MLNNLRKCKKSKILKKKVSKISFNIFCIVMLVFEILALVGIWSYILVDVLRNRKASKEMDEKFSRIVKKVISNENRDSCN